MRTKAQPDCRPRAEWGKVRAVRPTDLVVRFAFGAAVSVAAGLIGKIGSPRLGGMFLAFPSILPASLTLIQQKEGTRKADRSAIGAVLGAIGLATFAGVAEATFHHLAAPLVLIAALTSWVAVILLLYICLAFSQPDACDARRD